jgi:hypothetical protein
MSVNFGLCQDAKLQDLRSQAGAAQTAKRVQRSSGPFFRSAGSGG